MLPDRISGEVIHQVTDQVVNQVTEGTPEPRSWAERFEGIHSRLPEFLHTTPLHIKVAFGIAALSVILAPHIAPAALLYVGAATLTRWVITRVNVHKPGLLLPAGEAADRLIRMNQWLPWTGLALSAVACTITPTVGMAIAGSVGLLQGLADQVSVDQIQREQSGLSSN